MQTLLKDASQKKITARLTACALIWIWAGIDWVGGFWLMVAGYDDRVIGKVLSTVGPVGFFMMVIGLAMILWGFQVAVWGVEMFRGKPGLTQRLRHMVLGVVLLGLCGIGAGLGLELYAKFIRHWSTRNWVMLCLPVVGLVVLLAITHEVLRRAVREERQAGAAAPGS